MSEYEGLWLTNKQACVANVSIRRVALQNHSVGPVTDFSRYIKPLDAVLNAMSDQQRLLERYQEKFGALEEPEELEELGEVEELE